MKRINLLFMCVLSALVIPGSLTDLIGLALMGAVCALQYLSAKPRKA